MSMRRFSTLASLAASDLAIGFAIQVFVLLSVGVGATTDAFYAGQAPPIVLLAIFQLPLQRAVVATFAGEGQVPFPAVKLLLAAMSTMAVLVLVLSLLAPALIAVLYSELPAAAQATAVEVLRVQGLVVTATIGNLVLLSLNHVDGRFMQSEMAMLMASACAALFVFFAVSHLGVVAASYGQLIKALISGGLYLLILRSRLTWGRPPWEKTWGIIRPLASAGALTKLAPVIDRSIASAAPHGSMTMLTFGQAMYGAATGIAERSIVAPRLPALKRGEMSESPVIIAAQLGLAGLVMAVLLVLLAILTRQLDIAGDFISPQMLDTLIVSLACLGGFPVAALSVQWMAAAMVILGKPHVSARIVTWGFVASVPLKLIGFWLGGIHGLAVAISIYYLANAAAFVIVLRRLQKMRPAAAAA